MSLCYNTPMNRRYSAFFFCLPAFCGLLVFGAVVRVLAASAIPETKDVSSVSRIEKEIYDGYIQCFERVYDTMEKNYYRPVARQAFDRFIAKFDKDIYGKLDKKDERSNFICWRSSAFLVDFLKDQEDTFSAFFPPAAAQKFEQQVVLGQKVDLGIEGKLVSNGFLVTLVEPRSDAYAKGLKADDIIQMINKTDIVSLKEEVIRDMLMPLIDTTVVLDYLDAGTKALKTMEVVSREYVKQTVFPIPVDVPGVYGLGIKSFNRKTSDDLFRYLSIIEKYKGTCLILDLRGNPGGPPLAAQEISAFFITAGQELAYFQKKGQNKAMLTSPSIPEEYRYSGPIAILVDKKSGSAAELFSGFMQKHKRAVLIGENTAGKVYLKSMFPFDDGSMLLLVTARGHYPDDSVFNFEGVVPDVSVTDEKINLIQFAAEYLKSQKTPGVN